MSTQNVVERILSDANAEAEKIIQDGNAKAMDIRRASMEKAQSKQREVEAEVQEKARVLIEKKEAAARLECSKIALSAKRKVIDQLYAMALKRLVSLDKEQTLALAKSLLEKYAEEGDVICLAENFAYESELAILPVIEKKGLSIAKDRLGLDGGMRLIGKLSDKDLSYGALLKADRDKFQAELAAKIFNA